jgi:uncharacterized membrane protein YidH (DUF202 family)
MESTFRSELRALFIIVRGIATIVLGLWAFQQFIWLLWALGGY